MKRANDQKLKGPTLKNQKVGNQKRKGLVTKNEKKLTIQNLKVWQPKLHDIHLMVTESSPQSSDGFNHCGRFFSFFLLPPFFDV
jgi:hypothetical protein